MTETAATPPFDTAPPPPTEALLVRPREGRIIAGVCAGIAQRWNLDITLVRVLTIVLALLSGVGLAAYVAIWALTPSTDGPAPVQPGGRWSRLGGRAPTILLIVLAAIVMSALFHSLWWGAPFGLVVAVLVIAFIVGTRRGRWVLAGVAAVLALGLGTVGVFGPHFGTRSYTVSSISELRSSYDYGVGDVHLDLSNLALTGRHHTDVRLGRGDVTVTVPSNVAVFVR